MCEERLLPERADQIEFSSPVFPATIFYLLKDARNRVTQQQFSCPLKKIYKDDPDALHEAHSSQTMLYNVTSQMSELIMGMDIAIEEKGGNKVTSNGFVLKDIANGTIIWFWGM